MSEVLESLFQCRPVKAFAKQFKELEKEWAEPAAFVKQAAGYLGPRLHQPFYDEDTPHSLFGLGTAMEAASLFPEERIWWPFVQQAWHAANERRRRPLPYAQIKASGSGSTEERWNACRDALRSQDFGAAFGLARGLYEKDPQALADCLRQDAFDNSALGGMGFLFVSEYLDLTTQLDPEAALGILAGIVHLAAHGPRNCELASAVDQANSRGAGATGKDKLSAADYQSLEQGILFSGEVTEALQTASRVLSRCSLEGYWDGLLLAGINAVCNARSGHWTRPVRAFLLTYLAQRQCVAGALGDPRRAALYAAALTHQASVRSRTSTSNRDLEEVARELCPLDPFGTLRSLVSHSDPFASATAVYAILGMGEEKHEELYQSLATLAAKNDGRMGRGYDLLLVKAAVESFQASQLPDKARFLSGCAFFLGRLKKDYELFGAYGV